jgi:hypothetical protein
MPGLFRYVSTSIQLRLAARSRWSRQSSWSRAANPVRGSTYTQGVVDPHPGRFTSAEGPRERAFGVLGDHAVCRACDS